MVVEEKTIKETTRIYPEDRLALKWDLCLSDALLKTATGTGLGILFSVVAFNRRPWPVALGFGTGMGMAISNCRHEFARQKYFATLDKDYHGPAYPYYDDNKHKWWNFRGYNVDRNRIEQFEGRAKPRIIEVIEDEERYDPQHYKRLQEKVKDETDRFVYKSEKKFDEFGREIKGGVSRILTETDRIAAKGEKKFDEWGHEIKHAVGNVEDSVKNAGRKIESGFRNVENKIEDGIKTAGAKLGSGLKTAGEKIESGFKTSGDKIESGLRKAGNSIERSVDNLDLKYKDGKYYYGSTPAEKVEYAAWRQTNDFTKH